MLGMCIDVFAFPEFFLIFCIVSVFWVVELLLVDLLLIDLFELLEISVELELRFELELLDATFDDIF